MSTVKLHPVKDDAKSRTKYPLYVYEKMYQESIDNPEAFWAEQGKRIDWIKPYTQVKNTSFNSQGLNIEWYKDGVLNASVNCLDRHLKTRADQTAIIFEGDDPSVSKHISYQDLYEETCKFANVLKSQGVKKR